MLTTLSHLLFEEQVLDIGLRVVGKGRATLDNGSFQAVRGWLWQLKAAFGSDWSLIDG
jgi:hypothetical protein